MIPLRFIGEAQGNQVSWDGNTETAYITTPKKTVTPQPPVTIGNAIESKIDGIFEGWDGDTIFQLINGQTWQQDSYDYMYHYAFMPDVLIYKDGIRYKMKVEGVDDVIYVKRLK